MVWRIGWPLNMTPFAKNSHLDLLLQPFNGDIGSMGRCTVLLEPLSVHGRVESSLKLCTKLVKNLDIVLSSHLQLLHPFGKKMGQ